MSYKSCVRYQANIHYGDNGLSSINRIICTGDGNKRCIGCSFYTKIIAPIKIISLAEQISKLKTEVVE